MAPCSSQAQKPFAQHFPADGWVEHDAEEICDDDGRVRARGARRAKLDAKRDRRHRHRRSSARRWWSGTARPGGRSIARSSGRTGAPPTVPRARREARRRELVAADGAPARSVFLRDQARVDPRSRGRRARARRTRRAARGTIDRWLALEAHRRRACTRPTRRTRRARCSSTSTRRRGATSCCALFGVPRAMLPEVRDSAGGLRRTPTPTSSARRPDRARSSATSRRRGRPGRASPPARRRRPTARDASCSCTRASTPLRLDAPAAHHRRAAARRRVRRTRSRGASSTRARWCSGCATSSA